LSHFTSPFFVKGFFKIGSWGFLHDPPDVCLLSN
jgi:hypothetical protein